jgi:hypothetical protein
MADLFISYRSDDRGAVEDIVRGLAAEGVAVWWDQGIAPTAEWRAEIARQLAAAKAVVVVWSRNSVDFEAGKWVIQEAEEADRLGRLIPVCIDDVLPPLGLRHVQAADLVDWRGDRGDPRWRGFLETVRAKLEGRAVDAAVARDVGPATAGQAVRGRVAQLFLAVGLAALVATSAFAFGPVIAAAAVGGLILAYLVMNLLFSRRRNDRAAATFLRRAFAVGWVTTLANIVVWTAAAGAGAWPFAKPYIYPEFSIAVFDELRTPIPDAQVIVSFGGREQRVDLGADGVGRLAYPLYWGPGAGSVTIRHNDYVFTREIARGAERRFADLTLGAPSGVERLRVSHVTLEELAIDAVLQGQLPEDLQSVFPNVAGVVRNAVWREADAFLAMFAPLRDGGGFMGAQVRPAGAPVDDAETGELVGEEVMAGGFERGPQFGALRWPDPSGITTDGLVFRGDVDFSNGIVGCAMQTPLDDLYRLGLGGGDSYYVSDRLTLPPATRDAIARTGARPVEDGDGYVFGAVTRLLDGAWASQVLDGARAAAQRLDKPYDENAYMRFLASRQAPPGMSVARLRLAWRFADGCEGGFTAEVSVELPRPELRVSVIQNVSDAPLPIDQILNGLDTRDSIEIWRAGGAVDEAEATPWPGGQLAPGQSIVVPRRLLLVGENSPEEVQAYRAEATGAPLSFQVVSDAPGADHFGGDPSLEDPYFAAELRRQEAQAGFSATGFTIRAGQVSVGEGDGFQPWRRDENALYAVGPSVETLAVTMNGVEFPLREDAGVTLAMIGSCQCGSCPFVYAAAPGGEALLNRGPIISDLIGISAEGPDRVYLGRAVGRVEIREVEPEVSHLDAVRLIVVGADGQERSYPAELPVLRTVDGRRHSLEQGDHVGVTFAGYTPRLDDRAVFLEAVGYYTPHEASAQEMAALRRAGFAQ